MKFSDFLASIVRKLIIFVFNSHLSAFWRRKVEIYVYPTIWQPETIAIRDGQTAPPGIH